MSWLSLALFRAFKTSLLVRNIDGHYAQTEEPPAAKLEIVMGVTVPEEFLLSELWYCQNHKRNPWFAESLVEALLTQPGYSHMARVERICPAMGLTPIPACDLLDIGDIHDVSSFEQYSNFATTQWLYAKGSDQIHERCVKKEDRFPIGVNPDAAGSESLVFFWKLVWNSWT